MLLLWGQLARHNLRYATHSRNHFLQRPLTNILDWYQPGDSVYLRMQESFFLTRFSTFMQHFVKKYPEVKLRVESGFYQDILDQVLEHAVDFGIVPYDPKRNDLVFYPLVEDKLIFVASNKLMREVEDVGQTRLSKEVMISFGTVCRQS